MGEAKNGEYTSSNWPCSKSVVYQVDKKREGVGDGETGGEKREGNETCKNINNVVCM